jgi:hypothetical protein
MILDKEFDVVRLTITSDSEQLDVDLPQLDETMPQIGSQV